MSKSTKRISKNKKSNEATIVKVPIAGGMVKINKVPRITSSERGCFITHTEAFFGAAGGPLGVYVGARPALIPSNLPWLNGVANSFNKWKWVKLLLIYIPACPTTTTGENAIALSYDRQDGLPTTFAELQQIYKSVAGPVWAGYDGSALMHNHNLVHVPGAIAIDVDVNQFAYKYYRYMGLGAFNALSPADQNDYCPASMEIGNQGAPGTANFGRIYARYVVELIEPFTAIRNI